MKPRLATALPLFLFFSLIFSSGSLYAQKEEKVNLQFGNPGKNCTGFGICSISSSPGGFATISYNEKEKTATIRFTETALTTRQPDKKQFLKTGNSFKVEIEGITKLPPTLSQKMSKKNNLQLKAGNYTATRSGDKVVIKISTSFDEADALF